MSVLLKIFMRHLYFLFLDFVFMELFVSCLHECQKVFYLGIICYYLRSQQSCMSHVYFLCKCWSVCLFCYKALVVYLHELLLLLLPGADGVPDGAHLAEDGLRLLHLVAIRAAGHFLVDPGGEEGEEAGRQSGWKVMSTPVHSLSVDTKNRVNNKHLGSSFSYSDGGFPAWSQPGSCSGPTSSLEARDGRAAVSRWRSSITHSLSLHILTVTAECCSSLTTKLWHSFSSFVQTQQTQADLSV